MPQRSRARSNDKDLNIFMAQPDLPYSHFKDSELSADRGCLIATGCNQAVLLIKAEQLITAFT